MIVSGELTAALAMQPQIPTLQTCNKTKIQAQAKVYIGSRSDAEREGIFGIMAEAACHPGQGYPRGKVELFKLNMNDSWVRGTIVATTIDHMTSTGGRAPMAFLSGRCQVHHSGPPVVEPVDPTDVSPNEAQDRIGIDVDPTFERPTPLNPFSGCRYWIMVADNKEGDHAAVSPLETADVVSVLVMNGRGRRIAHGTGPVVSGDVSVAPSRH